MAEPISHWEELLFVLGRQRSGEDPARTRAISQFAAEWLAEGEEVALSPPPRRDEREDTLEPQLSLLRLFGRLNRGLSELLYSHSYRELPPLLGSDFGDWAVGSLVREAYLDLRMAAFALHNGLDLQAMSLVRQMAELAWRALIVTAEPDVADEWWESIVASAEGGERDKLEKRLWRRHFRPAAMLRHVSEIEARLDGAQGAAAEHVARGIIARKSAIYSLLSGTSHGGTELVYASAVRGSGTRLPEDPFAELGRPTELGRELVTAALYLQARFWRYFPLAAFPDAVGRPVPPTTPQGALAVTAEAVEQLVETRYAEYVTL